MTSDIRSPSGDAPSGDATDNGNISFADFDLDEALQGTLAREGLVKPTPIQQMAIPALLSGQDLIGLAQTGTGKTAAFLLPMLTMLSYSPAVRAGHPPKALVLAPTRELANQISANMRTLARDMNLRHLAVFGGARYDAQIKGLRRGVDVVIATPGRLIDLMDRGAFDPSGVMFLVLDEADHMLDLGFYEPIKRIIGELPKNRQTMLFSATMPKTIEALAQSMLVDPVHVKAPQTGITADKIAQRVTLMPESDKRDRLCDVLNDENTGQCLIFVRTKRRADALAKFMQVRGFAIDALHGDMRQGLRQKVLRNFRDGGLQALIATDVAARGIDVAGLSHVVNFDITDTPEAYVHRIGRTGRAGLGGLAISFCAPSEESQLAAIISVVGARVELFDVNGNAVTDFQAKPAPRKRGRGSRARREQPATQRRTPKDAAAKAKSEGRTAKRKWGQSKGHDDEWSPLENARPKRARAGGDGTNKKRDDNERTGLKPRNKPVGKPDGKPVGKPTGNRAKQNKNAQHKFAENKFASGKPRHEKSRPDRGDQASARHNKQGGKRPERTSAGNTHNPFAKNPFAKRSSGAESRGDGKPATRGSKPGNKSFGKPGGKQGGKLAGKQSGKQGAGNKPANRSSRRPANSRGGDSRLKRRGK